MTQKILLFVSHRRQKVKTNPINLQPGRLTKVLPNLSRISQFSYGQADTGNMIIHGENLDVLKLLYTEFYGKVRCIYIDPPYNNNEHYTHYNDDLEHEEWLSSIISRVALYVDLLREDGSLWISIDDNELHYLKVAVDKILGRHNFLTTIIWEQRTTRENRKVFSNNHEYILVYAKNPKVFRETRHLLNFSPEALSRYKNPDNDPRGPWQSVSANVQAGHATPSQFYEIISPSGKHYSPPNGRCWVYNYERMQEEIKKNNIWFGINGNSVPRRKVFLSDSGRGLTPHTLWSAIEVGTSKSAKKHLLKMFPGAPVFDTPKPEQLVHRILSIATDPGDLVLDSYLGSGTTAAVAHKMGRRYIGIEIGEHAITHCAKRIQLVVDGEDGGISELVGWKGGCGFDFYRFEQDSMM